MAFEPVLNLADLDGSNGFVITGVDGRDRSGFSVNSAGDINGDGFADQIVLTVIRDQLRHATF